MSNLKVKVTVRPRSLMIAAAAINAANELTIPLDTTITSGNDSEHMTGSKHYTGDALDFRTKHLAPPQRAKWMSVIARRLGPNYQLILEDAGKPNEHLHIEWEPK